ncbi:ribonuclease [Mycobacteroides abscessus subsp. abscessus]|nr:ribonuclease [Mycobacteroides abscessus subsp. abscessus]SLC94819.1 ribonuclease [Mycobacteroides abscessus subsp. abscessus]SLH56850.1 ribonuclease [Mycobacteroides abscessus subsp. abscessus]
MNAIQKSCIPTRAFMSRLPCRTSSAVAILAVVAAAIAASITAPEPTSGSALMVIAIARADCPPDCGPGGGTPSGPLGGGTEFIPPSVPSVPSYEPGRGQPPMDQNNGISIYNSAAPQPSQPAQPSQQPVQNQDGSYNRAANGEQQPINYNNAPNSQGINNDWQQLSDRLNSPQGRGGQQPGQQTAQNNEQQDGQDQATSRRCENLAQSLTPAIEPSQELVDEELRNLRELHGPLPSANGSDRGNRPSEYEIAYDFAKMRANQGRTDIDFTDVSDAECESYFDSNSTEADAVIDYPVKDEPTNDLSGCLGNGSEFYTKWGVPILDNNGKYVGAGDITVLARRIPGTETVDYAAILNGNSETAHLTLPMKADGRVRILSIENQPTRWGISQGPGFPLGSLTGKSVDIPVNVALCPDLGPVPTEAVERLREIDNRTWPGSGTRGTKGGGVWNNDKRQLPKNIAYQEWDQSDKIPNVSRDSFRIITGSDGSAYFTPDHYRSFVRIR